MIKPYIEDYIQLYESKFNEQLIQNRYNSEVSKNITDIFVRPRLYDYSEYEKGKEENRNKNRIDIDSILTDSINYKISGEECIGKTTALKYLFIKTKDIDKIPFFLSFDKLKHESSDLLYKIVSEIAQNNIKMDLDIELMNGNCVILIDDVISSNKYYNQIIEFSKKYPNNKIIITEIENQYTKLTSIETEIEPDDDNKFFVDMYLHEFGIRELKTMTSKWFENSIIDDYTTFNSMKEFIFSNRLPRTPLIYSLFLSIIEKDSSFMPINVASLFEKFADIYLGKFNILPNSSGNYDYSLKQFILEELAKYMVDNNKKYLSGSDYTEFIKNFSKSKGRKINEKLLLQDLINSNFIFADSTNIKFTFDCFMFFFYAKYIQRNQKEKLLLESINLFKFYNIIDFYSGLLLNSEDILISCMTSVMDKFNIDSNKMNNSIKAYYENADTDVLINLPSKKKSDQQINKELDNREKTENVMEQGIDKIPEAELTDEENDVFSSLLLLGSVLKNSEYVSNELKKEVLDYCLECYSWMVCGVIEEINKRIDRKSMESEQSKSDKKEESESKKESEEESEKENSKEEENLKYQMIILITLVIQTISTSSVGTTMLEEQINDMIKEPKNIFYEFLAIMLACDLEIANYIEYIDKFVKKTENMVLLQCIRIKLEMLFMERSYSKSGNNKNKTLNLIEYILRKIYGNNVSGTKKMSEVFYDINAHMENIKKEKLLYDIRQDKLMVSK